MKKIFTLLMFLPFVLNSQVVTYDIFEGDLDGLSFDACGDGVLLLNDGCAAAPSNWGFSWTSLGDAEPLSVTIEMNIVGTCDDLDSDFEVNGVVQGTVDNYIEGCGCGMNSSLQTKTVNVGDYIFDGVNSLNVLEQNNCAGLSPNAAWDGAFARVTVEYPCTPTEITPDEANIDFSDVYCGGTYEVTDVPTATNDCGYNFDGTTTDPTSFTDFGVYTINWEYDDGEGNITTQEQTVELVEDSPVPVVADLPVLTDECLVEVTESPIALENCSATIEEVYNINLGDIFGLDIDCTTGSYFGSGDFGFTWTSLAPAEAISSITLEINLGANCDGVTDLPLALNGNNQGSIDTWNFCNCDKTNAFSRTVVLNPADYQVGEENEIYIINATALEIGLSENVDWADAFARVTVNYKEAVTATTTDPLVYDQAGDYIITWTYEGSNGNTTTQEQTVSVIDNEAPVISDCPADISIETNNDNCSAIVSWAEPTAVDNCDDSPSMISTHSPDDVFPSGVTDVIYTFGDAAGNESTCEFTVEVTNDVDVVATSTDALCNGSSDGSAEATPTGGDPDYSYIWVNEFETVVSTDQEAMGLPAGDYEVTVTDQNGCTASTVTTVNEPDEVEIAISSTEDPSACGVNDGEAVITVSGGTIAVDYDYEWSNTDGVISTDQNPTNLPPGVTTILVTDDNDCTASNTVALSNADGPTIVLDGASSLLDLTCYGDEDAAITIDVTLNGGATAVDFDWNSGTYTTQSIADLTAGTYTVVATDDNNCIRSESYEVTQPTEIVISGEVDNATCNGESDGSVAITVDGGTVGGDYNYDWTDGAGFTSTDQNLVDVSAATYAVFVTDDEGCQVNNTFTVSEPNALSATANVTDEETGADGAITLTVSGGVGARSYSWTGPGGYTSTQQNISGLVGGTYQVQITDDCGSFSLTVVVNSTIGLESLETFNFKVYPNPSTAIFYVDAPATSEKFTYSVVDITGKVVLTKESNEEKTTLDLSNCEKGVYLLRVENREASSTMKLIVN